MPDPEEGKTTSPAPTPRNEEPKQGEGKSKRAAQKKEEDSVLGARGEVLQPKDSPVNQNGFLGVDPDRQHLHPEDEK